MKGYRLFITVPTILNDMLELKAKENGCSVSQVAIHAFNSYLKSPNFEYGSPGVLTPEDLDAIRKVFESMPIVPMSTPTPHLFEEPAEDSGFLHKGLTIPTTGRMRGPDEPRRKALPIEPGDNAVRKLKERGIESYDVIKAKRNWRAGREYNKELEQYFNLF